jgi:hypothetical protein
MAKTTITVEEVETSMCGPDGPLMLCGACGDKANTPMESDAYKYECPACGVRDWSSVEELMMRGEVEVV